jgi:hypothetical protein
LVGLNFNPTNYDYDDYDDDHDDGWLRQIWLIIIKRKAKGVHSVQVIHIT